jgi:hypothetical protein
MHSSGYAHVQHRIVMAAQLEATRKDVSVAGGALIRQRQWLVMQQQVRDRSQASPMIAPIMADVKPLGSRPHYHSQCGSRPDTIAARLIEMGVGVRKQQLVFLAFVVMLLGIPAAAQAEDFCSSLNRIIADVPNNFRTNEQLTGFDCSPFTRAVV